MTIGTFVSPASVAPSLGTPVERIRKRRPGTAKQNDQTLQVVGGDSITVRYLDDNTKEGKKNVVREKTVEVVSTGGVTFTLGTYKSLASAAYIGQPLFLRGPRT